jgi:hypothetical protein
MARSSTIALSTLLALSAITLSVSAEVALSRRDADVFVQKIRTINENSVKSVKAPSARQTPVTEGEVNSYLRIHASDQIPPGVVDPYVTILGEGRLVGRATVDLDAVRKKQSSGGWLDPTSYLTGRLPITATGVLHTSEGVGRFTLEEATISGVAVPKSVLQQILSYYSRAPENPDGINLDDPFELPAHIREIRVGKGQALVVQ